MAGDSSHIKQFLQYQGDFLAYLVAITRDFDAAEEIFQNAAVVVIERDDQEDPIRDFRAWAKEVVRRQALYYIRQQQAGRKRVRLIENKLLDQITKTFFESETSEGELRSEVGALRACIAELEEPASTMITMRYEQKATFDQISSVVDKTAGAVQRAISRLRQLLKNCVTSKLATEGTR